MLKKTMSLTACAARYWSSDNASTTGAALAFYCAFSLAPLLVIILTLAGLILGATACLGGVRDEGSKPDKPRTSGSGRISRRSHSNRTSPSSRSG